MDGIILKMLKKAKEIKMILNQIDGKERPMLRTGEIFPTYQAPVICNDDKVKMLEWGYPKFSAKGVVINAGSETAAQKFTNENLQIR